MLSRPVAGLQWRTETQSQPASQRQVLCLWLVETAAKATWLAGLWILPADQKKRYLNASMPVAVPAASDWLVQQMLPAENYNLCHHIKLNVSQKPKTDATNAYAQQQLKIK